MTMVKETMDKYLTKVFSRSEKNEGYFVIGRANNRMCYCTSGKAYEILSIYVAMDFGDGMTLTTFYDKYIAAEEVPDFMAVGHTEDKLICSSNTYGYQAVGFESEKLEEAEDKDKINNPKQIFIYFRSKYRHNFIYADTLHSSIRLVDELADVDEDGNPRPDAITTWCVSMFAPKEKVAAKPGNQENNNACSEVKDNV